MIRDRSAIPPADLSLMPEDLRKWISQLPLNCANLVNLMYHMRRFTFSEVMAEAKKRKIRCNDAILRHICSTSFVTEANEVGGETEYFFPPPPMNVTVVVESEGVTTVFHPEDVFPFRLAMMCGVDPKRVLNAITMIAIEGRKRFGIPENAAPHEVLSALAALPKEQPSPDVP